MLFTLFSIRLQGNQISGEIPTELCALADLRILSLSSNALSGSIPTCIGTQLSNLGALAVSSNVLGGSVPADLAALTNLQYAFFDDNVLTGDPAPLFTNWTNLLYLTAGNNQFNSTLDASFLLHATALQEVDLSNNSFTGPFPAHLLNLPSLAVLDLSVNQLTGGFPSDFAVNTTATALRYLAAYENKLTGPVTSLAVLTSLRHLDLSNNNLTGPMDAMGEMTDLVSLYLSENPHFDSGIVPAAFANLTLHELSLRNTNRAGPLPDGLVLARSAAALRLLDLGSNNFTGPVPDAYGTFPALAFLLLNDNENITGALPPSFANVTALQGAFLDGTSLNGTAAMDLLCALPNFAEITGAEVLFADCGSCPCSGCKCCNVSLSAGGGCSRPLLDNLDLSSDEVSIDRASHQTYAFRNDTVNASRPTN